MSSIIINGKSSNTIKGLIILDLPSIVKPEKRVTKEEIDGRDGDIITELGYSSYDKTLKIGLANEYDIDEIIEYFNAKGEIIFSNELTKVYKFEIYKQIDFNALLRFRTANVKIHVQPFKYLNNEPKITKTLKEELDGEKITIEKGGVAEILLEGNSTQEGTPTPDNPSEIKSVTSINEVIQNKNLFDFENYMENIFNSTKRTKLEDGGWQIKHNDTVSSIYEGLIKAPSILSFDVKMSEESTINYRPTFTFRVYYEDGTNERVAFSQSASYEKKYITFNKNIIIITNTYLGTSPYTIIKNVQLEEGTTATEYTPHQETNITIPLQQPFRSIGETRDCFEKVDGKWYEKHNIGEMQLTSDLAYSVDEFTNANRISVSVYQSVAKNHTQIVSNYFNWYDFSNSERTVGQISGSSSTTASRCWLWVDNTEIKSVDDFKTWLSTHNTVIDYILAEPTYLECTEQQTTTLNSLQNLHLYDEINYIYSENEVSPIINVTHYSNEDVTFENQGNIYAKPILIIKGKDTTKVYLNDMQIFTIELEDEITIDTENMEAYNDGVLKNRQVTGNYDNFIIKKGNNKINFEGKVESIEITKYSRWL